MHYVQQLEESVRSDADGHIYRLRHGLCQEIKERDHQLHLERVPCREAKHLIEKSQAVATTVPWPNCKAKYDSRYKAFLQMAPRDDVGKNYKALSDRRVARLRDELGQIEAAHLLATSKLEAQLNILHLERDNLGASPRELSNKYERVRSKCVRARFEDRRIHMALDPETQPLGPPAPIPIAKHGEVGAVPVATLLTSTIVQKPTKVATSQQSFSQGSEPPGQDGGQPPGQDGAPSQGGGSGGSGGGPSSGPPGIDGGGPPGPGNDHASGHT